MMKYYAVTDDPNELLHYGVKGMKWGEHIFGDKFKSAGYKRALGKLRSFSKKTPSAVKKSVSQRQMDKQKKQQEKYNNAVKSAQQRIKVVEGLNRITKLGSQEKNTARQMRIQQKKDKIAAKKEAISQRNELAAAKTDLKYFKNVSKMDKFTQKAREGKLKYGKLSDDQVGQIVNRLNMEQNARRLGSTEKSWHQQKKEARRKGKLLGIEKGTAAAMEEVARAGTVWGVHHLMNRVKMNAAAKQEGKEEHIRNRAKNKKTRKEVRQDIRNEMYEEAIASGKGILERRPRLTTAGAARKLESIRNENLEAERVRKLNARMNDEIDMANNRKYQKMLSDKAERERSQKVINDVKNERDKEFYKLTESGEYDVNDPERLKKQYDKAFGSAKTKEMFGRGVRKFNKLDETGKRNVVLDLKKASDDKEHNEVLNKYEEIRKKQELHNRAERDYQKAIDSYYKRIAEWEKTQRGKKPVKPSRSSYFRNLPEISSLDWNTYNSFTSLNLPSFYQGDGGKKKNN